MNLCVIGTGYVGLVIGACFANLGNKVICIDKSKGKIDMLNKDIMPIYEKGLKEICTKNRMNGNLIFTDNLDYGVQYSDIIFITVGTPSNIDGSVDLSYVMEVSKEIAKSISRYKIIVNKSTVPIGTQKLVQKTIRENLLSNIDFDVVSIPEFLKEGSGVKDVFNADRIIIGSESNRATDILLSLYEPFGAPIEVMNPESAEMVKYASNAFLATKISFINEIANICEKYGADIHRVVKGIGLDSRISHKFLNAGIGYGGSCFPKDTRAIIGMAKNIGYEFKILNSVIEVNEAQKIKPIEKLQRALKDFHDKTIAILGLSFKPDTDDIRESPALEIIRSIQHLGGRIKAYDPIAMNNAKKILKDIDYHSNVYDTVKDTDAIILATEWTEFKNIDLKKVRQLVKNPLFIDGRNVFDYSNMKKLGFEYYCIGGKDDSNKIT